MQAHILQAHSMKLQALKTMKSLDPEPVLWLSSKLKLTDGIPLQGKAACMGHLSQTILAFGVTTNVSAGDQAWPRNLHDAGLRTRVLQRACGSHFMTPLCFYIWKIPVPEVDCQGCCERRLACPTAPSSPWGLWGGGSMLLKSLQTGTWEPAGWEAEGRPGAQGLL